MSTALACLRTAALALTVAVALITSGCSSDASWHPVTTEESQILATVRFNNYDAGTRDISTHVRVLGSELHLLGWYDFATHVGYASVEGAGFAAQAMLWTPARIGIRPQMPDPSGFPEFPVPDPAHDGWEVRPLDPTASTLDTLLLSIATLGSDRPDNPLLLQQSGALFLGTGDLTTKAGLSEDADPSAELSIFAPPPDDVALGPEDERPTPESADARLWVDDRGLLHHAELRIGAEWSAVDFGSGDGPDLHHLGDLLASHGEKAADE
ncbi:hypothetical protein [Microbacterium soli]|uniref:Uncharacterized protein n=1 Tax=Microbacterium soli TaxID=446075 RepID=A0ABP7MTM3_9MICO